MLALYNAIQFCVFLVSYNLIQAVKKDACIELEFSNFSRLIADSMLPNLESLSCCKYNSNHHQSLELESL